MYPKRIAIFIVGVLLVFALVLASCQQEPEMEQVEVTRIVEVEVPVETEPETIEVTRIVEVAAAPEMPAAVTDLAIIDQWANSPHNRADDEAFVHWNEDGQVEEACARCHSTPGYVDYLGGDGSEVGVVNAPAPLGTTVECSACHSEAAQNLTAVTFPSGVTIEGLTDEARCMVCHQGRASTVDVNTAVEGLDPDTVSEDLGFINIHYYAAAATKYGTEVMGGYEYDGKSYDAEFAHVAPFDTCIECHDPHTLEVQVEECSACHEGVETVEDLQNVRMVSSLVDYDGDGNLDEGILSEINGLQEMALEAMQAYASNVVEGGITYDEASYPYFFNDAGERFAQWTPRLLKAAYNYQVSKKDPGEFAHGGKYIIELLYDSIEDLNQVLSEPIDLSNAHRIDHGHFAGSEEAFRHWDEEGAVPSSCAKCHSATGLPQLLSEGVITSQPISNGFQCTTCHSSLETFERYVTEQVTFPSGATVGFEDTDSNLCINCHQGRESTVSVNRTIGDTPDNQVSEDLSFRNVHYFAAGATLFGNEVQGAYQFDGQEYVGRNEHVGAYNTCSECHNAHQLTVEVEACGTCHEVVTSEEDLRSIRLSDGDPVDYDGDGNVEEGIAGEVETLAEQLYAAIQAYAEATDGVDPIVYDGHAYPYFFNDAGERYATWTPALLRAAYNYQYVQKDPGAFAHNSDYIMQILYDSIAHVGGDVSGLVRPEVPQQ